MSSSVLGQMPYMDTIIWTKYVDIIWHDSDLWAFLVPNNNYVYFYLTYFVFIRIIIQNATHG